MSFDFGFSVVLALGISQLFVSFLTDLSSSNADFIYSESSGLIPSLHIYIQNSNQETVVLLVSPKTTEVNSYLLFDKASFDDIA